MGHKVLCWMLFGLIGSGLFAADESLDSGMAAIAPIQGIHAYPVSEVCEAILTCAEFIEVLKTHEIAISMDGKGCWRDNVLIERFWRTIKYQEVYLKAYESASDARTNIRRFIDFYNSVRGHSSLQGQPPDSIYFNNTGAAVAA